MINYVAHYDGFWGRLEFAVLLFSLSRKSLLKQPKTHHNLIFAVITHH